MMRLCEMTPFFVSCLFLSFLCLSVGLLVPLATGFGWVESRIFSCSSVCMYEDEHVVVLSHNQKYLWTRLHAGNDDRDDDMI